MSSETLLLSLPIIGKAVLDSDGRVVTRIRPQNEWIHPNRNPNSSLKQARESLTKFLLGAETSVDFPTSSLGGTREEREILEAIGRIRYGRTSLAKTVALDAGVGDEELVLRVCLTNPFPILIPCHRVLSRAGTYDNYLFGEGVKRRLLRLESY